MNFKFFSLDIFQSSYMCQHLRLIKVGLNFQNQCKFYNDIFTPSKVTGVNIHVITPVVCFVCVFYTCLVGLHRNIKFTVLIADIIICCHSIKGRSESCSLDGRRTDILHVWRIDSGRDKGYNESGRAQ